MIGSGIVKRLLALLLTAFLIVLVACTDDIEETVNKTNEDIKQEAKSESKLNKKIDINETLEFEQFDINFKNAKTYEEKDVLLLDIHFDWRNKGLGDGGTLFVATELDVVQNDSELSDINDHWNPEGDRGLQNDVFMNTAAGSSQPVKLTYELVDKESDIKLTFTPTTETEDSQTITISLE